MRAAAAEAAWAWFGPAVSCAAADARPAAEWMDAEPVGSVSAEAGCSPDELVLDDCWAAVDWCPAGLSQADWARDDSSQDDLAGADSAEDGPEALSPGGC